MSGVRAFVPAWVLLIDMPYAAACSDGGAQGAAGEGYQRDLVFLAVPVTETNLTSNDVVAIHILNS